ncbi:MCE family protein [Mycobacterium sp. NPDC003449]
MNRWFKRVLAGALVMMVFVSAGILIRTRVNDGSTVVAYFANSNGVFAGDEVRVLGVPVGKITRIDPEPNRAKITFSLNGDVKVPADANAVIIAPSLVAVRAIQITPAYNGGPVMPAGAVIPESRTAVPVEWDELRVQLQKLTETLQPTQPGGVSTAGELINTAADNLRGRGTDIHGTLVALAQAFSALGDHSNDIFSTVKNVSILVSALSSSRDLMRQLNDNFAAVTALLSNQPNEVGQAIGSVNAVIGDVENFVNENKDTLGTTGDKLASVSTAVHQSLEDIKQTLHVSPNAAANFLNVYNPAQGAVTGSLAATNFSNPIQFICGAVQAASRLNAEQASRLCVQYLAPIFKNRQINFPPLGFNALVGAQARPNELTYSEDWMRPDYVPPQPQSEPGGVTPDGTPAPPALPAEAADGPSATHTTDPSMGLQGIIMPTGGG